MKCPHCEGELTTALKLPEEQTMKMALEYEGDLLLSDNVWQPIKATADALKATGKALGTEVSVFVRSIRMESKRLEVEFFVTGRKP